MNITHASLHLYTGGGRGRRAHCATETADSTAVQYSSPGKVFNGSMSDSVVTEKGHGSPYLRLYVIGGSLVDQTQNAETLRAVVRLTNSNSRSLGEELARSV